MRWVAARRVVARVQHVRLFACQLAPKNDKGDTMRKPDFFAIDDVTTVAIAFFV
jgi:hypothetical protein